MLIQCDPNGTPEEKDFIDFYPEGIVDGMKIGIIMEKLKAQKTSVKINMKGDEIESLSILKKDLVNVLC